MSSICCTITPIPLTTCAPRAGRNSPDPMPRLSILSLPYVTMPPRMTDATTATKGLGVFERYLTLWVVLCIAAGIFLGKTAPGIATFLDGLALYIGEAPIVSLPIAICLFFMMYPIMVKIDFGEVVKAGRNVQPVTLTLMLNWAIKPFTMYAIALFFLGTLFLGFIGPDAMDHVKLPLGLDLPLGATYGSGSVVGVLIEVPVMLMLVRICQRTQGWFAPHV